jgi:hypothetical protein
MNGLRSGAAAFALALLPSMASAQQISTCSQIGASPNFKLVVDKISLTNASDANLAQVTSTLVANLQMNFSAFQADDVGGIEFVACPARQPQVADFDATRVRQLYDQRVILEMWGIGGAGTAAGEYQAAVTYFLVPVRYFATQSQASFTIPLRGRARAPLDELMKDLSQTDALKAYFAVAMGTKLLQEGQYDLARKSLCHAESSLAAAGPAAAPPAFVTWVKSVSESVVRKALDDPAYKGALRLGASQGPAPCLK